MVDGWEATLLDVVPNPGLVTPKASTASETGSPEFDTIVLASDTGEPEFDPTEVIRTAPTVARVAGKVAGGSRTTAGRVLSGVATVGGDMASGAAAGAAIGSVIPGIGTAIGGVVGAAAGLVGGLISVFSHHDDDPVANKLHALAQKDPRRYGPDLVIYTHNPARYHALARHHELPSERWGRRHAAGGIEAWLRRTHATVGAQLASRFGGRPLAERALLGYAAATESLEDVEQALDGIVHTPHLPPRSTLRQLVAGLSSAQIARVAAAFAVGPDVAVETYRAVRREHGDEATSLRARILRALVEQWAKGAPASVALFERLARSYSPDQAQQLRRALVAGDPGPVFRRIEETNRAARDHQMIAAFERYAIEWFAHKADAHPSTPLAETPLRQAENIDVIPLRATSQAAAATPATPKPAGDEIVALLVDDRILDDEPVVDTGDAFAFAPMAPGAWVPGHWEERDGRRLWIAGHWSGVPTFDALTEGFDRAQLARLQQAIERGTGRAVYRRIVEERMARARAARELLFLTELRRAGCVPGQPCRLPPERLAAFSSLWASYSPDQVLRIQNALLTGDVDPLLLFRELERESHDDRVRRLHAGWNHYLTQWNTAGAPNPAALSNYAYLVTEQMLGNDTSGFFDVIGNAFGNLTKSGGAGESTGASPLDQVGDLAKKALGVLGVQGGARGQSPLDQVGDLATKALGAATGGGGAQGPSPLEHVGDLAKQALSAVTGGAVNAGGASGHSPLGHVGELAKKTLDTVIITDEPSHATPSHGAHAHGGGSSSNPLAALGNMAKQAVSAVSGAASGHVGGGTPSPAWPARWAEIGAKVQQGLSAIGLTDLATAPPRKLLGLVPPRLGLATTADGPSWWKHLTRGQGLDGKSIQPLLAAVKGISSPQAIPQVVAQYRDLVHARLDRQGHARERVFGQITRALAQRQGPMADPWSLAEINNPLLLLTQRMDRGQVARLRDAFVTGADTLAVFKAIERENREGHAARAAAYFKRYLGALRPMGETGDPSAAYPGAPSAGMPFPSAPYVQGALQQAAVALQQAQLPGFDNLPGLQASLQNALGALLGAQPGMPRGGAPGLQHPTPGFVPPSVFPGASQPGYGAPGGAPGGAFPGNLQNALQNALGALQQAQGVPGLDNLPALQGALQNALGALQGAQQPGFNNPPGLQAALQQALGALQQAQAQGVPGFDNVPGVLQSVLGALQGAAPRGALPAGSEDPFGFVPGAQHPSANLGTETAGPVTEDARPCPLFHLTLPQMSVPAWTTSYRMMPHKQPLGVEQEIAGVRGRARDVSGVDAVTGEYVATPGETAWSIAEKLVGDGRREHELLACNPARAPHHARWRIPPSWFQFIQYVGPVRWHAHEFLDEGEANEDEAGAVVPGALDPRHKKNKGKRKKAPRRRSHRGPSATASAAPSSGATTVVVVGGKDGEREDEESDDADEDDDTGAPDDVGAPDDEIGAPDDVGDVGAPDEAGADEAGGDEDTGDDGDTPELVPTFDPAQLVSQPYVAAPAPMRASDRPTLTTRTYHVNSGDYPAQIATKFGARSRPHWFRELAEANPQLTVKNGNFTTFYAGSTINIPDAWPPSPLAQPAPGLAPQPTPAPVVPGPTPAFPPVDNVVPAVPGVPSVPAGSAVKGAVVDPGVLQRVERQLFGWALLNPGQSGSTPDFGATDVDGLVTERTTRAMAAWERWHNARGDSPVLPTDGVITLAAASALNQWWEAQGHQAVDSFLAHKGAPKPGHKPGPKPAGGPAPKPSPAPAPTPMSNPSPGMAGMPPLDLGWLAAQAQQTAAQAAQIAQQTLAKAQAGGNTPDLQASVAQAQQAAAKAADDARRAVLEAQRAAQQTAQQAAQGGAPPGVPQAAAQTAQAMQQAAQQAMQQAQRAAQQAQQAQADLDPVPAPPPAKKAPAKSSGADVVPLASLAAALWGALS
jgi:hypothetical protein